MKFTRFKGSMKTFFHVIQRKHEKLLSRVLPQSTHFSMLLLIRTMYNIKSGYQFILFPLGPFVSSFVDFSIGKVKIETNGSYVSETNL
jgi:hypothetical protein